MEGASEILSETGTNCNIPPMCDYYDSNQTKLDALEKKAIHLRLLLEKDLKAADIKWSLFITAAFSFKYESCLKPFPPGFLKNGEKDMDTLLSVIAKVPALDLVLQQLNNLDHLMSIGHIIDLLFYVLVRLKEPNIKTVPPEAHDPILLSVNSTIPDVKPQYIFQVESSCTWLAETRWRELAKNRSTFFAYHGSPLENFYSMLYFGVQPQVKKVDQMSPSNGVLLSPEMNMVLPHSHGGFSWGASCLGGYLTCLALCEVIDAPDGINCQKPVSNEGDGIIEDGNNVTPNNMKIVSEQNPDTQTLQYVMTNNELVRIRYLVIYAKQAISTRIPTHNIWQDGGGLRQWFSKHKLFSILLGYGIMLATIGLANNQPIHHFYNTFMKKIEFVLDNSKI